MPLPAYTRRPDDGRPDPGRTEWLLTNGLGGFAMGTVLGAPARRYHGLLVAAMSPPVGRMAMLSGVVERLTLDPGRPGERTVDLSAFRFAGGAPPAQPHWVGFAKGRTCHWVYRFAGVQVDREIELARGHNAVRIRYRVGPDPAAPPGAGPAAARLTLRPLIAMRDFHGLVRADEAHHWYRLAPDERGVEAHAHGFVLAIAGPSYRHDPQWWYNFDYELDRERGQDHTEDLLSPGEFTSTGDARAGWEYQVEASAGPAPAVAPSMVRGRQRVGRPADPSALLGPDHPDAPWVARLVAAADDFVVRRAAAGGRPAGTSIIAGYPWFSDWGRDSMISLPGLLLLTGRFDEARELLETFAAHARDGLIPNCFDNATGRAEHNTVDASLWFLHAACEYRRFSGDPGAFDGPLGRACLEIIDAYERGTDFGIRVDPADGLVMAGDATTQLTWMDARRDGVAFTPRHGKPVEVNALWHHGLLSVAEAIADADPGHAGALRAAAARAAASFRAKFWNPSERCLHDVLTPDGRGGWTPSPQLRPNQIFAVSLRHTPLSTEQQRSVVRRVRERLLTRHGLRTLDPADPAYQGSFHGNLFERDSAYHNGTVWPWLIGPFVEALLRASGWTDEARREARALLQPLLEALDGECPGQLPEVYDGDDTPDRPQRPGGCPAQAWSIAEVLRALVLCAAPAPDASSAIGPRTASTMR